MERQLRQANLEFRGEMGAIENELVHAAEEARSREAELERRLADLESELGAVRLRGASLGVVFRGVAEAAATPAVPVVAPASGSDSASTVSMPAVEIQEMVLAWRSAWQDQRVDDYLAFYSTEFELPQGQSRSRWESRRRRSLSSPRLISISLADFRLLEVARQRASIGFTQRYQSDAYGDTVFKVLDLRFESGEWKISRERSSSDPG